jgi:hypothetical protein
LKKLLLHRSKSEAALSVYPKVSTIILVTNNAFNANLKEVLPKWQHFELLLSYLEWLVKEFSDFVWGYKLG